MKKTIKLIDQDCGHCADKIENAVKKIDGVTSVSVNFLGGRWLRKRRMTSLMPSWPKQRH
ncbi:MAG: heavy-metal-associated domain-containing protein [Neglectibacter sp.]